jgi:hypothetical protein
MKAIASCFCTWPKKWQTAKSCLIRFRGLQGVVLRTFGFLPGVRDLAPVQKTAALMRTSSRLNYLLAPGRVPAYLYDTLFPLNCARRL